MALSQHTVVAIGWISIFAGSFFLYSTAHDYLSAKRKETLRERRAILKRLKDRESQTQEAQEQSS